MDATVSFLSTHWYLVLCQTVFVGPVVLMTVFPFANRLSARSRKLARWRAWVGCSHESRVAPPSWWHAIQQGVASFHAVSQRDCQHDFVNYTNVWSTRQAPTTNTFNAKRHLKRGKNIFFPTPQQYTRV